LNVTAAPTELTGTNVVEFSILGPDMSLANGRDKGQFGVTIESVEPGTDISRVDSG
jgi:hypothetical protein